MEGNVLNYFFKCSLNEILVAVKFKTVKNLKFAKKKN
jgi:hypothetical protein